MCIVRWQTLSMDLSLQAYYLPGFSVKGQETHLIQLFSECIIATIAMYLQCVPKNWEVDHLTLGSSSIPFVTFFWDTLYVPRMCEIYNSFQVTPHCTEQTLCTVWRKSWPCFRKLPRRQHVDMHGLQLRIPIPDPVWSLHSCLGLRVWKTSDKTFCQHGHVSSGDHSGHVCHVVVSDTLVF